jgi:hypothetical protein
MRDFIFSRQFYPFLFVAACATTPGTPGDGSGSGSGIDFPTIVGAPTDVIVPPVPLLACDYTEQDDATNDYLAASGYALEQTGVAFAGTTRTICGTINTGHFDSYFDSVDIDNYGVTLAADGDVSVTLTGAAQAISSVGVYAYDADTGESVGSYFYGDHGVFTAHLAAGNYEFSVEAYDNQDATAEVAYKVQITTDHPFQRCARVTHAADYVEQGDGVASTSNDMVDVDDAQFPSAFRTAGGDAPEIANMTMSAPSTYRIYGDSGERVADGSYFDRDTYAVTAGPDTNQLSVRLNWGSPDADFDFYVFEADSTIAIGKAVTAKMGEDEYATFPVIPMHEYWLWVGASTTSTAMPADYDASLCPQTYTVE